MDYIKNVGDCVRDYLESKNMSMHELSVKAKMHHAVIKNIMDSNKKEVYLSTLIKLAKGMHMDLFDMLAYNSKQSNKKRS